MYIYNVLNYCKHLYLSSQFLQKLYVYTNIFIIISFLYQ